MRPIKVLRRKTVSVVIAFLTIPTCFVVYGNLIRGTASNSKPAYSQIAQTGSVPGKLEVELITSGTSGFEPAEIVRPKGPFVLLVDDRSGNEASSLSLQRLQGENVRNINTKRTKSEWHDVINLPPGDYVLTNTEIPGLHCQITILP